MEKLTCLFNSSSNQKQLNVVYIYLTKNMFAGSLKTIKYKNTCRYAD